MLLKCPACGRLTAIVNNVPHCLHCGRTWENQESVKPKTSKFLLAQNERIRDQAHKNLLNNLDGSLDYCIRRGITMYTILSCKLGYVSENFELLPVSWHRRILFPIYSNDGSCVIGFGGRKTTTDERAKYINSSKSPCYNKSESLYGYHLVPDNAETVYLCEGYIDVLSMDSKGFAYPVASLGTALTSEQALLIRKKAQRVVICYDADAAGQKSALRAIDLLAKAGFKTSEIAVMVISDAKDVDEALQHGGTICEQSLLMYLDKRGEYDMFVDALVNI